MTAAFEPNQQPSGQDTASQAAALELEWAPPRWEGATRDYWATDVVRLRGRVSEEHTLARRGSEKLWKQLTSEHKEGKYTNALGALTGTRPCSRSRPASAPSTCPAGRLPPTPTRSLSKIKPGIHHEY